MVSSSINTRHINVKYLFIKDRIKAGEVEILHCPSSDMIADFFTKPFQEKRFFELQELIMGEEYNNG
jgi:hypothetical protein